MVPGAGLEPARSITPRDFKSLVSTNFTTRAQAARKKISLKRCRAIAGASIASLWVQPSGILWSFSRLALEDLRMRSGYAVRLYL